MGVFWQGWISFDLFTYLLVPNPLIPADAGTQVLTVQPLV